MPRGVMIIGRAASDIPFIQGWLKGLNVSFYTGTQAADFHRSLKEAQDKNETIDDVFLGAGLDLEERLNITREIVQSSAPTRVHFKDRGTGPKGMPPMVKAVMSGMEQHEQIEKEYDEYRAANV